MEVERDEFFPAKRRQFSGQHEIAESQGRNHVDDIVWPAVVVLENTRVCVDKNGIFKGLESEEIRMFIRGLKSDIDFSKVVSLYGSQGHRGVSLVLFPRNYLGFLEAEDLDERLRRSERGRERFMRVRPRDFYPRSISSWNSPELVSSDGKRVIYGYLATPADMERLDPAKKVVKRWCVESKIEKVLKPHEQAEKEREELKQKLRMLEEEKKRNEMTLRKDMSDYGTLAEQLTRKNDEIEVRRRREAEMEKEHESQLDDRKRQHEAEKRRIKVQYEEFDRKIRQALEKNKELLQAENAKEVSACEQLRVQKTYWSLAYVAERRQLAAMQSVNDESKLRVTMENRLAVLAEEQIRKKTELQKLQNEELLRLKEEHRLEREALLKKNMEEQEKRMKEEMEDAKEDSGPSSSQLVKTMNCSVCEQVYDKERPRAMYDCGHVNICHLCVKDLWKKKVKKCLTCDSIQKTIPRPMHHQAYC